MEDLLVAILQFLFEFCLEIFSYSSFDWPFSPTTRSESTTIVGKCFLWFVGGGVLAWLSVLILKHTLISMSVLRMVNLVLAPITSAFIAQAIARHRSQHNRFIIPRHHFWQSFWFTLGIVLVRFAYAVRA